MSYGTNAPWGLAPTRMLNGSTWNGALNEYQLPSGYATNLFKGDPVYVTGTGTIVIATAGAGNPITGVFMGVKYTSTIQGVNGNQVFAPNWVAGTVTQGAANALALICDDPNVVYNIQSNNATGVLAADLYNNADLVAGAGSTYSGISGWMLDQATIGTGATKQLKILRLVPVPGNVYGGYDNVEVVINNDYYKGGTGTVGV